MSSLFASGGQNTGASASASVVPMNIQGWFPLGLTGLISLQSKGLSRVFCQHHSSKAPILQHSAFFIAQLSHPDIYMMGENQNRGWLWQEMGGWAGDWLRRSMRELCVVTVMLHILMKVWIAKVVYSYVRTLGESLNLQREKNYE